MGKRLMSLLLTLLGVLVAFALWLMLREEAMIYYPSREIQETPAHRGGNFVADRHRRCETQRLVCTQ